MPAKNTSVDVPMLSRITSDGGAIDKMHNLIRKAVANLEVMKTVAAASCVMHAIEFGNATKMNDFLSAVGKGERNDAIVKWAIEFGPFKWEKDKDTKVTEFKIDSQRRLEIAEQTEFAPGGVLNLTAEVAKELRETLASNPYWVFVPQKQVPPFNLPAAILSLVKRAEKAKGNPSIADKSDFSGLTELEALAATRAKVA